MLCIVSLGIRWPGVVPYDGVFQYEQAAEGAYGDWHPPIMAHAWALLNRIHDGSQPFFVLQVLLWWCGLGLMAAALARGGRRGAACAVLLVGAAPPLLGWVTVVVKDAQMACCLTACAGIAGWWRLAERRVPYWASGVILPLLGYATLVRGNAVFACAPFALALFGWARLRRWWTRTAATLVLVLAVIAAGPVINHRLLDAEATHVERAVMVFDLAGIAHRADLATIPGLPPAAWAEAEARGCYTPYFWNPYGEPAECDFVGQALAFGKDAPPHIARVWLAQVARHPIAYALHRAAHLNANLRFWVGRGEADAVPPIRSEPNDDGLGAPATRPAVWLVGAAGWMLATPLGWPCVWLAVALGLLWASARTAGGGQAALGRALALSAACMSGSFAVVSIASDLRYHLWSMIAAALALVLLADARALERRRALAACAAVAAVVVLGIAARAGLAAPVDIPLPPRRVTAVHG